MSQTSDPRTGQFWTLETNGHRVLIDSATQYALDATVTVRDIDGDGTLSQVRVEWFVNHATLLHDGMIAAHLEAIVETMAPAAISEISALTDGLSRARAEVQNINDRIAFRDRRIAVLESMLTECESADGERLRLFVVANMSHDYDENSDVVVLAQDTDEAAEFALKAFPRYALRDLEVTEHSMTAAGNVFVAFHPG